MATNSHKTDQKFFGGFPGGKDRVKNLRRPGPLGGVILLCLLFVKPHTLSAQATSPFDLAEIRDETTLDVTILQDWHVDTVSGMTRQKLIEINVAEWWPGQDYRIPVRLIAPLTGKAAGFHITGNHAYASMTGDAGLDTLDQLLINGSVGVVYTVVQALPDIPGGNLLLEQMTNRFISTHNPRYMTAWIWGMTLMRAATAALAETDYFDPGKIAGSGGSKNGVAPAVALINDDRFTATHSTVAPAYASPLRLYDPATIDQATAADDWFFAALDIGAIDPGDHTVSWYRSKSFIAASGWHVGPINQGWSWEEVRQLAEDTKDYFYISETWDAIVSRGAEAFFHPATHDWVAWDILWGAQHHPEIPVYYLPNGGHDQTPHPMAATDEQNRDAFLLKHFLGGTDPMLEPPTSSYEIVANELLVTVRFDSGPQPTNGRIWWIYNRHRAGSAPFLWKRIPDDQWKDMVYDATGGDWTASIPLDMFASSIEFFTNHGIEVDGRQTYLSSPYTRVPLAFELPTLSPISLIILASAVLVTESAASKRLFASSYSDRDRELPNSSEKILEDERNI